MDFKNYNTLQDSVGKQSPSALPPSSNITPISDQDLKNKKEMPRSLGIFLTVLSGIAVYSTWLLDTTNRPTNFADSSVIGIRTGTSMSANSVIEPSDRVVFGGDWNEEGSNLIFCGHYPAPDIDSVAAAIGAAELYNGTASIPHEALNKESSYVLDRFGVEKPRFVTVLMEENENAKVVLVDFNADTQIDPGTQIVPGIDHKKIVGFIDHHGVNDFAKNLVSTPMLVLIEPWGSACTIVTGLFQAIGKTPTKSTAGCLLSGIISDTLNLKGPTTAVQDRNAVNYLSKIALKDPDTPWNKKKAVKDLFIDQVTVKANTTGDNDTKIINSDAKVFSCIDDSDAQWGTVEGLDPFYSEFIEYSRICEWGAAIKQQQKKVKYTFVSFVDVVDFESVVMTAGNESGKMLEEAFGTIPLFDNTTTTDLCDGMTIIKTKNEQDDKGRVSRKNEFMPPINQACSSQKNK